VTRLSWLDRPRFSWLHVIFLAVFTVIQVVLQSVTGWWPADIILLGFAALAYAAGSMIERHRKAARRAA
jgi:hypothetical protein